MWYVDCRVRIQKQSLMVGIRGQGKRAKAGGGRCC